MLIDAAIAAILRNHAMHLGHPPHHLYTFSAYAVQAHQLQVLRENERSSTFYFVLFMNKFNIFVKWRDLICTIAPFLCAMSVSYSVYDCEGVKDMSLS